MAEQGESHDYSSSGVCCSVLRVWAGRRMNVQRQGNLERIEGRGEEEKLSL